MRARDLCVETASALSANKGRSLLTILGVVIGIAAVIAMTSLIGGIQNSLMSELGLEQSRMVILEAWGPSHGMQYDDLEKIENDIEGLETVSGTQWGYGDISTSTKQTGASVLGVDENYFTIVGSNLVAGRFITEQDDATGAQVVVLDAALMRQLFGDDPAEAVDSSVIIGNDEYTVIGIMESSGFLTGQNTAYVPYRTASIRITGTTNPDTVMGFAKEGQDMDAITQEITDYLRKLVGISEQDEEDGYGYVYVTSLESIQREVESTMASFQLIMTAVASISLLVGGIGIMNMMLTNVTERIREIGLRKALGARRKDIIAQFLAESVALTLIGGIVGVALGYSGSWALSGVASNLIMDGMRVVPYFSLKTALIVAAICISIGVVFGIGPARRAAKLDPVESLRYQ